LATRVLLRPQTHDHQSNGSIGTGLDDGLGDADAIRGPAPLAPNEGKTLGSK
jgi:hypothetical protein